MLEEYYTEVKSLPFGKKVGTSVYLHKDALENSYLKALVAELEEEIPKDYTLLKFHKKSPKVSLLYYFAFDEDPHPSLLRSICFDIEHGGYKDIDYSSRFNKPILHRKELFLNPEDPRVSLWSKMTQAEEEAGLYENKSRIGTEQYWAELLRLHNLAYEGHQLVQRSTHGQIN